MHWRFLDTEFHNAAYNMAVDEVLLAGIEHDQSSPVFRLFGWHPPGISFGYTQRPEVEFDLAHCRAHGVDLVRRLTGGRAVYHHHEITYSVTARENDPAIGGSLQEAYFAINRGLAHGLTKLGVISDFEKGKFEPDREKIKSPCFISTARYEITYDNKKLVGSAQRKLNGLLLQHGSILLDGHQEEMVALTRFAPERQQKLLDTLRQKTTSVSQILARPVSYTEVAAALKAGFAEQLGITFVDMELTAAEAKEVERLIAVKYSADAWNFKTDRYVADSGWQTVKTVV